MPETAGNLLVERFIAWGVGTIFRSPGDGIGGIFEAGIGYTYAGAATPRLIHDTLASVVVGRNAMATTGISRVGVQRRRGDGYEQVHEPRARN